MNTKTSPIAVNAEDLVIRPQPEWDFTPCNDLCLVEKLEDGDKTAGGIVIPEQSKDKHLPRWRIVKIGPGRVSQTGEAIPVRLHVGDDVLLAPQMGALLELPGASPKRALVSESAIIAVVRDKGLIQ